MATTRLIPMHKIKNQSIAYTVHKRINYAINPAKTLCGELVTTYGCDPATAANEMLLTKRAYADFTGREIPDSDVLLYQIRQSFKPGEVTPEQAQQIGYELAMTWTKRQRRFRPSASICWWTSRPNLPRAKGPDMRGGRRASI